MQNIGYGPVAQFLVFQYKYVIEPKQF